MYQEIPVSMPVKGKENNICTCSNMNMSLSYELQSIFWFANYNKILNAIHLKTIHCTWKSTEHFKLLRKKTLLHETKNNKNDFGHRKRMQLNFLLTDQMWSVYPVKTVTFSTQDISQKHLLKKTHTGNHKNNNICMYTVLIFSWPKFRNKIKIYKTLRN